jgi:hypothetical protein
MKFRDYDMFAALALLNRSIIYDSYVVKRGMSDRWALKMPLDHIDTTREWTQVEWTQIEWTQVEWTQVEWTRVGHAYIHVDHQLTYHVSSFCHAEGSKRYGCTRIKPNLL